MTVGALVVLVGWLLGSGPDATMDHPRAASRWRFWDSCSTDGTCERALVLAGIAVSWVTVFGAAVFAALLTVLLIRRFRGSARE